MGWSETLYPKQQDSIVSVDSLSVLPLVPESTLPHYEGPSLRKGIVLSRCLINLTGENVFPSLLST